MTRKLELSFSPTGTAQLVALKGDRIIWSSDEDEQWRDAHPDELLGEKDSDIVFDYLEGEKIITAEEGDLCEIYEEYIGGADEDDIGPGDEDDDDDDGDILQAVPW